MPHAACSTGPIEALLVLVGGALGILGGFPVSLSSTAQESVRGLARGSMALLNFIA